MTDRTSAPGSGAADGRRLPLHQRAIEIDAYDDGDRLTVVARLRDVRPWAADAGRAVVHDMQLELTVSVADLVITSASATMHAFPHAECPGIEAAFSGLVGLSVARGYTRAVSERFVGVTGCSHLEHLARAIGPAVVQAVASGFAMAHRDGAVAPPERRPSGTPWLRNTCHVWAEGGVGEQKVALGAIPIDREEYPVPSLEVLRRRQAAVADDMPRP